MQADTAKLWYSTMNEEVYIFGTCNSTSYSKLPVQKLQCSWNVMVSILFFTQCPIAEESNGSIPTYFQQ
jgi:hypothetical protein